MPFARALHTIAINGCFNIGASTSAVNFILKLEMTTFLKDAAAATIAKQEGSSYSLFWLFGETDETHRPSFEIKYRLVYCCSCCTGNIGSAVSSNIMGPVVANFYPWI